MRIHEALCLDVVIVYGPHETELMFATGLKSTTLMRQLRIQIDIPSHVQK